MGSGEQTYLFVNKPNGVEHVHRSCGDTDKTVICLIIKKQLEEGFGLRVPTLGGHLKN